ncbi:MAG: glutamyl-tRNA reductase [Pyrinomonadaceae bacterium]
MADQQMLFAFGLNHKTASIEVREKLYIRESEVPGLLAELKNTLSECVVLSTCNRTEIYGVSGQADLDLNFYKDLVIKFKRAEELVKREHFFTFISCAACQQLFNVVTSLDSKVIGDSQILGQVRNAYSLAKDNHSTGKILNQLSQRALKIGKKTFSETSIHKGAVSISLAAVELALDTFGSIKGKSVLIVGAGDTAKLTAECLIKQKTGKIFITNRTRAHAEDLLAKLYENHSFESEIIDFEDFKNHLGETDIVISSTSSREPILHKDDLLFQSNKILLLDIAVPRDIDPGVAENENVILKNIDDLHAVLDHNHERRMKDLLVVKKLIMKEMSEFLMWYYALALMPVLPKTYTKPDRATIAEMLSLKEFLIRNVSEFHKLAMQNKGNVRDDLINHVQLIKKLQSMKIDAAKVSNVQA